jgi:glycosyltransferase involved in cell wall biosynthesis
MKIVQITTDNREHNKDYDADNPYFGTAPEALFEGFSQISGIEVHVISCLRKAVVSPAMIAGNIHYHPLIVPKSGWMTSLYYGCIKAARVLIRELQPDVVHGQGTERECGMCAAHSGFPNVITIHGNMAELNRLGINFAGHRLYGYMASKLESHALGKCAGVLCHSAYTESLVAPRANKTWRVPNAIRSGFLSDLPSLYDRTDVPLLLNVGQLGVRKRQLEILKMAGAMHRQGYVFHLVFIGSIHQNDDYARAFVQELKRAESMGYASHAGWLDTGALVALMDQAQGFIHFPSEEAFGLVVAEAMARGLKFFGADLGGIKEIASGIPGAELHTTLADLQAGVARWLIAGASKVPEAAVAVRERYSPHVVAASHKKIYHELLMS